MPVETAPLFRPEDLEDACRTQALSDRDLGALHMTADWMRTFVSRPHADLGRPGPVCPFVPGACERGTLWLAVEQVAGRDLAALRDLVRGYQKRLLDAGSVDDEEAAHQAIVVVLADLPVERAKAFFDEILAQLAAASYAQDGLVMGGFFETNEGTAVHNPDFRPFRSPAPFLLIRRAVVGDWKFFLDDPDGLDLWARRFGRSAVHALADQLRRLPWRTRRD